MQVSDKNMTVDATLCLAMSKQLTAIEFGMLMTLSMQTILHGKLFDDDVRLAGICQMNLAEWKKNRTVMEFYFVVEDGWWTLNHEGVFESTLDEEEV